MRVLLPLFGIAAALAARPAPEDCSSGAVPVNTAWHTLVCPEQTTVDPKCYSTHWLPTGEAKGLVVLMHGYTACPDSFDDLAEAFQAEGYAVFNVLTVGHGKTYNDCPTPEDCVNGDPIYELPVHADEYLSWVDEVNMAVAKEATRLNVLGKVNIIGLSLGSALATAALARDTAKNIPLPDGSGSNKLYIRAVVFPPFYGVSVPNVDRQAQSCAGTKDECISSFAKSIAGRSSEGPSGSTADETEASGFEEVRIGVL